MSNKQPTITSFVSSGYETDNGTAPPPRRSSRVVTPARREPGMIIPSADSRRGLFDLGLGRDVRDEHVHRRRERSASLPGGLELGQPACDLTSLFHVSHCFCFIDRSINCLLFLIFFLFLLFCFINQSINLILFLIFLLFSYFLF
jgi:hypothetical protein